MQYVSQGLLHQKDEQLNRVFCYTTFKTSVCTCTFFVAFISIVHFLCKIGKFVSTGYVDVGRHVHLTHGFNHCYFCIFAEILLVFIMLIFIFSVYILISTVLVILLY